MRSSSAGTPTRVALAEALRLAGEPAEAASALEEALALYERKGDVVSAGKAQTLLDELRTPSA
jgi:hypothetical protein